MPLHDENVERYTNALADLEHIRAAWVEMGKPVTDVTPRGLVIPHPMLKEIREQTALTTRLGQVIAGKKTPGPEPKAVPSPLMPDPSKPSSPHLAAVEQR
jgi:hypothetical protein